MSITMGTTLASLVTNKRRVSALKSLGITGVQVRAVCPVGVDDISAAVQKFEPIS